MESFEIHITGSNQLILTELENLGIKSLSVGLMQPNGDILREEYMSSTVQKFKHLDDCIKWVDGLSAMLEAKGIIILRKKVECDPNYKHYINRALYMEAHWKTEDNSLVTPLSMNLKSGKVLATDRVFLKELFPQFKKKYHDLDYEVELCVLDTYIAEDFDWFSHYEI